MLRGIQFSIATILLAIFAFAIMLQYGQIWPVAVFVLICTIIFAGSEFLSRSLPANVEKLYRSNCTRADGSWSSNRESIENDQYRLFRSNIRLLVFIAVVPWAAIIWYQTFDFNEMVTAALIWILVSFVVVRSGYLYFLNQHIFRMKVRAQNFKLRDLHIHFKQMEQEEHDKKLTQIGEEATAPAANS